MWKSGVCIFLVWVTAIIALAINILATIKGTSDWTSTSIKATFRYQKLNMKFTQLDGSNTTQTVTYKQAHKDICDSNNLIGYDDDWCNALKNVRKGGEVYLALTTLGCVVLTIALVLCVLVFLGKCLCNCKCRFSIIIGILTFIGVVCIVLALVVGLAMYFGNLNDTANGIVWYYWPQYQIQGIDWNNGKAGGSFILLIISCILGLISCGIVCAVDRKNDKYNYYNHEKGEYLIVYQTGSNGPQNSHHDHQHSHHHQSGEGFIAQV